MIRDFKARKGGVINGNITILERSINGIIRWRENLMANIHVGGIFSKLTVV